MNRNLRTLSLTLLALILLPSWCFGAAWEGVRVLPRTSGLQVFSSPSGGISAAATQIDWPATVRKVDGQWLQVVDTGGYSAAPIEAWVRKDDIVRLDEAQFHSTRKIQECQARNASPQESAASYWLRGVYWENVGEVQNAIADYEQAQTMPGGWQGDIALRLGRTLAQRSNHLALPDDQRAALVTKSNQAFERARQAFESTGGRRCPPQLYVAWGDACYDRYRLSGDPQDAQAAVDKYESAKGLKPSWFVPLHGEGKVLLASAGKRNPDQDKIRKAIECFTESIRANPNSAESYRQRAEALMALSKAAGPSPRTVAVQEAVYSSDEPMDATRVQRLALLNEALDSAERAYLLGNNREPGSLETKARIEAAIANVLYADDPPLKNRPVPTNLKGSIDQARSLYRRASTHASTAANYSQTLDEIDRRMALAVDCHTRSRQYAAYLTSKPATTVATVSTASLKDASVKLASAAEQANQLEENLNQQAADLHATPLARAIAQHSASMAKAKTTVGDLQSQLNETVAKPASDRLKDVESLRTRVSDTSEAVRREHAALSEKLSAEADPEKRKSLEAALEKNQQLSQTLEQAAEDLSPPMPEPSVATSIDDPAPVYTPLYLNR